MVSDTLHEKRHCARKSLIAGRALCMAACHVISNILSFSELSFNLRRALKSRFFTVVTGTSKRQRLHFANSH